jgi:hypothetical protein
MKRQFRLRKPSFYPLNYGDKIIDFEILNIESASPSSNDRWVRTHRVVALASRAQGNE